jgi:hypothetical protein
MYEIIVTTSSVTNAGEGGLGLMLEGRRRSKLNIA